MALLADQSADANSNLVGGNGTNSARFTMPGGVAIKVESVVATIDNSAGGDTTATLTVADQSGEVIAKKRQDETVPSGDTGTATFALRLGDNAGGIIRFRKLNVGEWLNIHVTGPGGAFGQALRIVSDTKIGITALGQMILSGLGMLFNAQGGTFDFTSATALNATVDGFNVFADNVDINTTGGLPNGITLRGNVVIQLSTAGNTFVVRDHNGAALVTYTG